MRTAVSVGIDGRRRLTSTAPRSRPRRNARIGANLELLCTATRAKTAMLIVQITKAAAKTRSAYAARGAAAGRKALRGSAAAAGLQWPAAKLERVMILAIPRHWLMRSGGVAGGKIVTTRPDHTTKKSTVRSQPIIRSLSSARNGSSPKSRLPLQQTKWVKTQRVNLARSIHRTMTRVRWMRNSAER